MANDPDADAATRLEAALERIARLAHSPAAIPAAADPAAADPVAADRARALLAGRLDRIIARLREALDQGP